LRHFFAHSNGYAIVAIGPNCSDPLADKSGASLPLIAGASCYGSMLGDLSMIS
jgi:hypothetical protein